MIIVRMERPSMISKQDALVIATMAGRVPLVTPSIVISVPPPLATALVLASVLVRLTTPCSSSEALLANTDVPETTALMEEQLA